MNGKLESLTERLLILALIIVFILLLILSPSGENSSLQNIDEGGRGFRYERPLITVDCCEEIQTSEKTCEKAAAMPGTPAGVLSAPADKPYTLGRVYDRNLWVKVVVENNGNTPSQNIRLEIPLLGELDSPYQRTVKESYSREPVDVIKLKNNNRVGVFRIDSLPPGASDVITLEYYLNVYPMHANFSTNSKKNARGAPAGYLEASEKIESNHPKIVAKARELTASCSTDLEKAQAFYKFVIAHINYDLNSSTRNTGALGALQSRSGVCEEYASLFTALCRASGIPARVVNGYADPQGTGGIWNIAPGESFPLRGYRHSWSEFFLNGAGWLPADPAMNINNNGFKYFGSLPQASHLAQNYEDIPLNVRYSGGQLSVTWEEGLVGF
jgi:hypothetical protein